MVRFVVNSLISAIILAALSLAMILVVDSDGPQAIMPLPTACGNDLDTCWAATVKITDGEGWGTGVEGDYNFGWHRLHGILTAAHVACHSNLYIEDRGLNGLAKRECKVLYEDKDMDLAIMSVGGTYGPSIDLTPVGGVGLAESVWYIGHGATREKWLERSVVSRVSWDEYRFSEGFHGFCFTGKATWGSSGSPVFVRRLGRLHLAGIVSRYITEPEIGMTFLAPLAATQPIDVSSFLRRAAIRHGEIR